MSSRPPCPALRPVALRPIVGRFTGHRGLLSLVRRVPDLGIPLSSGCNARSSRRRALRTDRPVGSVPAERSLRARTTRSERYGGPRDAGNQSAQSVTWRTTPRRPCGAPTATTRWATRSPTQATASATAPRTSATSSTRASTTRLGRRIRARSRRPGARRGGGRPTLRAPPTPADRGPPAHPTVPPWRWRRTQGAPTCRRGRPATSRVAEEASRSRLAAAARTRVGARLGEGPGRPGRARHLSEGVPRRVARTAVRARSA